MKKAVLIIAILVIGCSQESDSSRTASQTLSQYFDAVNKQDTLKTFALSTRARVQNLQPHARDYFENCYNYPSKVTIISEIPSKTIDTESVVRFTEAYYLRTNGMLIDSALVDCAMIKENGEWKVSRCSQPISHFVVPKVTSSN